MNLSDYTFNPVLSRASTIPARWYTDPAMLESERRNVFGRTWQAVGRADLVAAPGSYFGCEIAGEPVLVARGQDGCLRAFSNVCRHRGSLLADGPGHYSGGGAVIRCPYHGWTYALDGSLFGQPEFEGVEDWDRSKVCLPRFQVAEWGPFVFVNQDAEHEGSSAAPPLAEVLGAIPAEIAQIGCAIDRLRFSYRRDYAIACNWKVYIDNYLEGYHLPAAHPGLFRVLDYAQYRVEEHRYHSSQIAPIRGSNQQALYYWVFPNFMLNVYPDNLSSNLIVPMGPDRTLTVFEWFAESEDGVKQATIDFSDEIQREDIRICESVQRGLRSRHYNQGRFSVKRENGVHHFHGLLNEFLRGVGS